MKTLLQKFKQGDQWFSTLLLFCIMIITLTQILLRELFNIPLIGVEELTRYLFISFVFLGLPYAFRSDGHIRLKGSWNTFSKKSQKVIDILIEALSVLVFATIAFSSIYTTLSNYKSTTLTISIPFWIFFLPTCVGFFLLTLEHLKKLLKRWRDNTA